MVRHCVVFLGPAQRLVLNHDGHCSQLYGADSMSWCHGWHMTQASQMEVRLYPSLVETGSECVCDPTQDSYSQYGTESFLRWHCCAGRM